MKKILKILGILIVLFLFIIGTTLTWLFSSSGNEFLKNKITQIANKKAPIGLEFTHFRGNYKNCRNFSKIKLIKLKQGRIKIKVFILYRIIKNADI